MSTDNKNKNENIEKMKELRKMVNYNFYGNEKDGEKENNKYEDKEKLKDIEGNNDGNKEKNVLNKISFKTGKIHFGVKVKF